MTDFTGSRGATKLYIAYTYTHTHTHTNDYTYNKALYVLALCYFHPLCLAGGTRGRKEEEEAANGHKRWRGVNRNHLNRKGIWHRA